jgi:hypothetical protein
MAGQVLRRTGRANSDERSSEPLEGVADACRGIFGQFAGSDEFADRSEAFALEGTEFDGGDVSPVRIGRYHKALRHRYTGPYQRGEVQSFGADRGSCLRRQTAERQNADVGFQAREYDDVALGVNKPGRSCPVAPSL